MFRKEHSDHGVDLSRGELRSQPFHPRRADARIRGQCPDTVRDRGDGRLSTTPQVIIAEQFDALGQGGPQFDSGSRTHLAKEIGWNFSIADPA